MKKLLPYILILVALVGIYSQTHSARAQADYHCYENSTGLINTTIGRAEDCLAPVYSWKQQPTGDTTPAATNPNIYTFLAPLPCDSSKAGADCKDDELSTFDPTQPNNLGVYLNIMIRLFIGICAVLAVVMIVMGGLEYVTSEVISEKSEGKKRITNAIFGLVLAMGAYLLLYTINPDLLKTDLSSLKNVEVTVNLQDDVPQTAGGSDGKTYKNSKYKKGDAWNDSIGLIQNIPGVTKNFKECSQVGESSCLSTRNLLLGGLNDVKNKCPGALPLGLNGGTEFWHHGGPSGSTTHGPASATVDIAPSRNLNKCLSGGLETMPTKKTRYGLYYWEINHWHIGA